MRKKICADEGIPNKSVWDLYLIKEGSPVKVGLMRIAFHAATEELGQHEDVEIEGSLHEKTVDLEEIIE